MPDSTDSYFSNDYETLTLQTSTGDTDYVAGIQGVTIEAEFGVLEDLYTADSVTRDASKQAEFTVPISIEYAFFDPVFVEEWLGGDGNTSTSGVNETSDPQQFQLNGVFRSRDNDKEIDVTVDGIRFPSIPIFDLSQDEYVVWGLEGEGSDISDFTAGQVV